MPIGRAPYKREHHQTRARGHQATVFCSFCGRKVPRHKCFISHRGFNITDTALRREIDLRNVSGSFLKQYACPACARHRGIVQKKTGQSNPRYRPRWMRR